MKPKPAFERRHAYYVPELRTDESAAGTKISGYAAKFNSPSEDLGGFVEFIRAGAFKASVAENDVRALVDHNPTLILGRNKAGTLRLEEDDTGLRYEADLPDTQAGRDIAVSIKRGDVSGCSFGFIVIEDAWTQDGAIAKRELIRVHLFDVGPVTFPAYPNTEVGLRSLEAFRQSHAPPASPRRDALNRWLLANAVR